MIGKIFRPESADKFDAQIAELKIHLKSLEQKQMSSTVSPNHRAELIQEQLMVQLQLQQLYQAVSHS